MTSIAATPFLLDRTLTEAQLRECLAYWQFRLALSDWRLDVGVVPAAQLTKGHLAECSWVLERRCAVIRITRAEDCDRGDDAPDMEQILVHELLHVVFAALDTFVMGDGQSIEGVAGVLDPVLEATLIEQPIDMLAHTLVYLRRAGGEHRFPWERRTPTKGGRRR